MMVASQWKMSSSARGPALHDVGGSFWRSCDTTRERERARASEGQRGAVIESRCVAAVGGGGNRTHSLRSTRSRPGETLSRARTKTGGERIEASRKPEIRGRRPPRMPPTCSSFVMRLDAIVKHSTVRYVLREGVRFVRGASAVK